MLGNVRNPKMIVMKAFDPEDPEVIAGNALWTFADYAHETEAAPDVPDESTRDTTVDYQASHHFKTSLQANAKQVMGGRRHL